LTDFTCQTDKQRNTKEWKKQQQKETAEFSSCVSDVMRQKFGEQHHDTAPSCTFNTPP
jgi:hypothetical protein